jgi:outer membrane protein assembly factor BamA
VVLLLGSLAGCASVPEGRAAVASVDVSGNEHVDESEITDAIATRASPRFLGLVRGLVYDYEIFNAFVLERDMARIERLYRARGYYRARVRASRVLHDDDDSVRVEIVVEEGPPVVVHDVALDGITGVDAGIQKDIDDIVARELPIGETFDEDRFKAAESAIKRALTDGGHAFAEVKREAEVDVVADDARCRFAVTPGPLAVFGDVTISGLEDLPEKKVLRTIDIEPGDPYSTAKLEDGQQAALDLGVFSSVRLVPDLRRDTSKPGTPVVPVHATVEVAELQRVKLGGGVGLDSLKSDVHLVAGWSSMNFLGGLRKFSIEARPGVVLHPLRINNWQAPTTPLPEGQIDVRLDQPGLFEARTNAFVAPSFRVYPVLLRSDVGAGDAILGFADTLGTVGVERNIWRAYLSVRQNIEYAVPFTYQGELGPFIAPVLLTWPEFIVRIDLTDDRGAPHQGVWIGTRLEGAILGDAQDFKVIPELRGFIPLGPLTLASRTSVGFMWPFNYGATLRDQARSPVGPTTQEEVRDLQLTFFRGFFAGGNQSNRGYPPRTISPYAMVPFLTPSSEAASASCTTADTSRCAVPVGGFTLWEASLELRYPIMDPFSGGVFCDAADVSAGQVDFRIDHPHLSCGTGLRYDTPAGPIRLDVAYRIPGMQVIGEHDENQGDPGTIFGAPINISAGIGEAF